MLATFHGGIPEAVDHGRTGLLVPERDTDGLFHHMRRLADEPGVWEALGAAAAADVRENFEHAAQIEKLESYYAEAVQMGRPRPATDAVRG